MEEKRKDYPAILEKLEVIYSVMEDNKKSLDGIKYILNGNGKKGLVAKVEDHDEYIKNSHAVMGQIRTAVIGGVVIILLGALAIKFGINYK